MSRDRLFALMRSEIRSPLNLIDVGAAGGALEGWKQFGDKAHVFCFEAREDEAGDLTTANREANIEYVPVALSSDRNGIDLTITSNLGCSSVFKPIRNLYRRYSGCAQMRPKGTASCPSTTIDDFMRERGLGQIDAIKLDAQGFALRILRGAEMALETCKLLIVETEFNPLYEGQDLFCDVDRFMRDRGFVLWRFGNLAHYGTERLDGDPKMLIGTDPGRQEHVSVPHGQLFWADAFYVRANTPATADASLSRDDAVAGAALVTQWGFADLALEMLRKSGDKELEFRARAAEDAIFADHVLPSYPASSLRSNVLETGGATLRTDFSNTDCCIVYGPYVRLPHGEFEATFHVGTEGLGDTLRSTILFDVNQDITRLEAAELIGAEGAEVLRSGEVRVRFFNNSARGQHEFRVLTEGKPFDGTLELKEVTLRAM